MKVVVMDKKEIHLMDGTRRAGDVVDLPEKAAMRYLAQGAVERYDTKVIRQHPSPAAGEVQQPSASQAAQASPETTSKPSGRGGRRRKKKRSESSS